MFDYEYVTGGMQFFLLFSALLGFGMMALLTPVPAYVGQLMASVQREKMNMVSKHPDWAKLYLPSPCTLD